MNTLSLLFLLACGEKSTDSATEPAGEPAAQPAAEPEAQPSNEPAAQPSNEPEAQPAAEPEAQPSNEPIGDAANGESIVNARCMGCHNGNPAIEDSSNMTDEELMDLFANGKGGMPSVDLSESDAMDVIAYLRQAYGGGQ